MTEKRRNDTAFFFDFRPVTALLEAQAHEHPEKAAVTARKETLSYKELNRRANRIAHSLIGLGVKAETVVGVMLERTVNAYAARQGVLKSGGAFVPVSPDYPDERLRYIFEDSGAPFVITTRKLMEQHSKLWRGIATKPLLIDELLGGGSDDDPNTEIHEHDLCYCIYTSGSTGRPKGVMLEHGNLANFVNPDPANRETSIYVQKGHVSLALAALTFDFSIMEEFVPLTNGLSVVLASEEEIENPLLLADLMIRSGVDAIMVTPSYLSAMLDFPRAAEALSHVAVYDFGAESFPGKLYDRITALRPDACIMNGYGPTEATISCTMKVIASNHDVTIGLPNGNVQIYIINENNEPVPDGEIGEMLVCGKGVGRGYKNLPEKSAEAFISFRGERAYKTGDLARVNEQGEIEFHGRKDDQVKLRGLRIELGEIESVFCLYPKIASCAAAVTDENSLCVYYTVSGEVNENELLEFASKSLADYMLPDILMRLDEMPLTQNKKIDRKALPRPKASQAEADLPENESQRRIFEIAASVMGHRDFGVHTDLYRAGLTSLRAMQLNVRLAEEFHAVIRTGDIHENPTVALLESFLARTSEAATHEKRETYPLTGSQKGIFVECSKNPESTLYNIPYLFELHPSIDEKRLLQAIGKVIKAHPYLLSRFGIDDTGEPCQKPCGDAFTPACIRLSDADFAAKKDSLVRPFRLEGDCLFRAELYLTDSKKYLLTDFHHIVADGNSYDIFFADLDRAYRGESLPPEKYTGYDAALDEERETERRQRAEGYYENLLSGVEAESLPVPDKKEEAPKKGLTERKTALSRSRIEAFCESLGITPNALFTGLFGILAARYSGSEEALFTTIYNGRNDSRLERTICMLVKTLPVYLRFDSHITVPVYLKQVQKQLMDSMANDIVSFADLAAKYGVTSDLMFAYQAELTDDYPLGGTMARGSDLSLDLPKEPLLIQVRLYGDTYVLTAEYRADLYDALTINGILESCEAGMQSLLRSRRVCEVSLLSDSQKRLLDAFNDTEVPFDHSRTIVDLFRETAENYPENTAVIYLDRRYAYRELDALSDNLAGYLQSLGIGREDVVSVLIGRSEYMAIASLGILKAGAAYQPLDPTYPPERLNFMIKDAGAKLLIAEESLLKILSEYRGETLLLEDIPSLPKCAELPKPPKPEDLFILLYTSGSTGTPKGVMLEHGNLAAFCHWYKRFYHLLPESRVAAYASYGFDADMMDLYPALTTGAGVCIVPEEMRLDIVAMNQYFETNHVTHSFLTTQVGRAFATTMENKTLLCLSTGGEALTPLEPPADYKFYNVYGPTECTIFTTAFHMDKAYRKVPIGKPLENIKLYVTDAQGHRLPAGACGELCISGRQVARGYLNRPEQTEKVFTKNPFCGQEGYERMYHSGDIVRYLPDGNIDFVGRRDGQVKIRGFRIELTEVEGIIREFPGIRDAAVAAFDDAGGGKYIAAYLVSDEKVDIQALNAFILKNKPPYMVPAAVMQIDAIPLNVNGKVDKKKLPKVQPKPQGGETEAKPATRLEERLCAILEGIIGHKPSTIGGSLLQDGLTSLSVIRLAVALNKEFGFEADVKELMRGCSVLSLENDIVAFLLEKASAPQEKTEEKARKTFYPLSRAQFGVYADCMKNPLSAIYNIFTIYEFPKEMDGERLANGVKTVLQAHPYLFTHLTLRDNDVMQTRGEDTDLEIPVREMSGEAWEDFKAGFSQPFDLMRGPLFRAAVIKTREAVYLLLEIHHILFDGGSLDLFQSQLKTVLEGGTIEEEKFSGYDYVDAETLSFTGEEYRKAEDYFAKMLADCEGASEIPPDLGGSFEDGEAREIFAPTDHAAAERFCAENGVTPAQLYMAALCYAASRFVNSRDVYINTISNGRSDLRLADSFGMFVKTIPIGVKVTDGTVLEFVSSVGQTFTEAIDNELYPYHEICKKYHYAPDIMYEYQIGVVTDLTVDGVLIKTESIESTKGKFKVCIRAEEHNGVPGIAVEYNNALYSQDLMEAFVQSVRTALTNMVNNPEEPIRKISLLDEKQLLLLHEFASTEPETPESLLMQTGFERQAEKNPEQCALIACDKTLTYKELDGLANTAAAALIKRGFGKGQRAVILLKRTSRLITAFLAVLKTGGAYIPVDPEYPKDRILSILEDSGAALVITEKERLSEYADAVDIDSLLTGSEKEKPDVSILPEDTAYLIYTSGSTGKPKGVILRHKGIANYLTDSPANIQVRYPVKYGHVYCSITTVSFDMSMKEIWVALSNGLTLAFADDTQAKDPAALAEFMKQTKADVINATPSRLLQYMELDCFMEAVRDCKVILAGGEKYPDQLLKLLKRETKAKLINTYGPTEITVSSNGADLTDSDEISVGRPLRGYTEYIVDSDKNLLPVGVVGELLIAGCGVAAGYHELPEQTEKAFIRFAGKRAYRSGDYARWTKDGNVVILGRTDNQIKLRGLRIELDEITKRLSAIDGIKTAVTVIRKLGAADAICAYYTAKRRMDVSFIKEELSKSLAAYMVPSSYNQLEKMPVTANGKTDIRALPAPASMERREGKAAANEIEQAFCDIFAKILELETVYAGDNFFELGGSSLTVTRIVIAAEKAGYKIAYADVFSHPTPASLADFISGGEEKSEFDDLGNYDYGKINALLAGNTLNALMKGEKQELGNVLLTGATGFLGIHVLHELLGQSGGRIYCLLRGKGRQTAKHRLSGMFFYYFDEEPLSAYENRLIITEGDITKPESFEELLEANIDTVINCAANVKHFSKGTDIEEVNYNGVCHLISFCKKAGCRLIQVSTNSIGGMVRREGRTLLEQELYIGQRQISKYTQSKFLAERTVLEAAAQGLNAKIMRVGNLSARDSDGEFQANFATNSFIGSLKASCLIGKHPYEEEEDRFELSPIDSTAKAILLLAETPRECVVFHPFNNHMLMMGDLYHVLNGLGFETKAAEDAEYQAALDAAKQDERIAKALSSMIAYQGLERGEKLYDVGKNNRYTMQALYRLGFRWPVTSEEYMKRFITALNGLGFFDRT